jgi:hypothetical protein
VSDHYFQLLDPDGNGVTVYTSHVGDLPVSSPLTSNPAPRVRFNLWSGRNRATHNARDITPARGVNG